MPGYSEAMLQGMQGLMGMRRLQDSEQNQQFNQRLHSQQLERQYRAMEAAERGRAATQLLQMQNQQRLQQAMEAANTQRDFSNKTMLQRLELQIKQMNQPRYGAVEELIGPDNKVRQVVRDSKSGTIADPRTLEPIPPGDAGQLRKALPLPIAEKKRLEGIGSALASHVALLKSFKPEYAGFVAEPLGDITALARERLPGLNADMPNWWRDQQKMARLPALGEAAGKSMTPREIAEFVKGDINNAMKPDDIISTYNRRIALLHQAAGRAANSAAAKYDPRQIEEALGFEMPPDPSKMTKFPDLNELTQRGARVSGVGRPSLDELFKAQ